MTHLTLAITFIVWVVLGLIVCSKKEWYKGWPVSEIMCMFTVLIGPLAALFYFINRIAIKKR